MSRLIDADVFIEYLGLNAENSREENLGEISSLERLFAEVDKLRDNTVVDDSDAVTDSRDKIDIVGGDKDSFAVSGKVVEHVHQGLIDHDVKTDGRFIKDPDGGVMNQRGHETDFLFHTVRIFSDLAV